MKKYLIYWHVKDNPETYAHNDNMLIYAKDEDEAYQKAKNRIMSEFDYGWSDVDHIEIIDASKEEK